MAKKKRMSKTVSDRITARNVEIRNSLWPGVDSSRLWSHKNSDGWTTIPRGMPIVYQIMNELTSGKPVASTHFDLWCHVRDESSLVQVSSMEERAFCSGFTGERAVFTWKQRVAKLKELGFIDVQPGASGDVGFVLLWNPYLVVRELHESAEQRISKRAYNALLARLIEIGAKDLQLTDDEVPF